MKLRLYKVTCYFDYESQLDTFENFVIAGNEIEAQRIVEEEIWTLGGMAIKCVEEVNMEYPQLLCSVNTDDI